MRDTIAELNDLERCGFFRRYAIAGAMGAIFYIEYFLTEDLDILVLLPDGASTLAPLSPPSAEAQRRGYGEDGPHLMICGRAVQVLPADNPIVG